MAFSWVAFIFLAQESTLKKNNTKDKDPQDRVPSNEDSTEASSEIKGDNGRVEPRRDQKQDLKPKAEQGKGLGSVFKKTIGLWHFLLFLSLYYLQ